jgi:amino acid adenylation domain-containing protein
MHVKRPGVPFIEPPAESPPAPPQAGPDPRKRLLELRLKQRLAAAPAGDIAPRADSCAIPLSFSQEGLWFLDQLGGPSGVYNIVRALRLHGPLDIEALRGAVQAVLTRHESLRTAFELREGAAVQVVMTPEAAAAARPLVPETLPPVAANEPEATLRAWLQGAACEPFDLGHAPLMRARLLRLQERDHVLLLRVHHIVADGWSMDVLGRELGALYAAFCAGLPDPLPALPIQFGDYTLWQRRHLQSAPAQRDLAYWCEQLAGLEPLQLPTDRPRPVRPDHQGAQETFAIEPALLAAVKALARRENATPFMVLLAAFQVLLMRYSGQHDVAVGTPVAGRSRTELEGLIGYFVNTVVLRGDLSGEPSFIELLRRVRQTCLDAYAHQELPFDRLVAELGPQRNLGRNPLYQVSFTLQNVAASALALGALRVQQLPVHNGTAKFDLSLSLTEEAPALAGMLEYRTDLFDASTVRRTVRHYRELLRAIAAAPEQSIAQLPLMDKHERAQLLHAWNATERDYPKHENLHQLFERQARCSPEACAVVLGRERLSYAELNARANRLAHRLRALGVGPDVLVGLYVRRNPSMVVALLAILKAGGAYVPLDPEYPAERLGLMLRDTAAPVVITEKGLHAQLPASHAQVLCVDSDDQAWARLPDHNLDPTAQPHHLAYVIYTSGSTGTPKGVAVPQQAVARLVIATDYVRLGAADVVAQASSSSFDAATFEVWGALLNGAQLVMVPKNVLLSGTALQRCIELHGINTMFLTTGLFNEHAAHTPALFGRLDQLLFGGEAVDPIAVRRVLDTAPPRRLLHVYGPTETTTFATWHEVARADVALSTAIPIGRPIANTRCHVLDANLQPAPVGAVGELYVGGAGLARGYLNRMDFTAERFVADPFRPGERLYRTGDRARYRNDGNLEFVGRMDQQVKIRGFRVEPGEIEAALGACPGVQKCAVLAREDQPGVKRLVAYVVSATGTPPPSARELRDRLAAQLPPYMVPSAVVALEAMPLTANGKLDRAALPVPEASGGECESTRGAPSDDLERDLQSIWEAMLGIHPIGVEDSFFDIGGHSLLAIRLLDAVERRFGRTLGLATLFEGPTIRGQAALLRRPAAAVPACCAVAVQPNGDRTPLFFVSGFGGAILPFEKLARELGDEQPLYVLDINSLAEFDGSKLTLEGVATQLLADMRRVQPHGPYQLAGFSLGGKIVYEMAQQLQRAGERVDLLALLDCAAPGFPRLRSFPVRVVLHVMYALEKEPRSAAIYLLQRIGMLKKYFGFAERGEPSVFKSKDIVDTSATLVRAIESRAQPIYEAWEQYEPEFYPGRMTLIRAEIREYPPGVVADDLKMGWGPLISGGIDVAALRCGHTEMLDEPNAPALAALLRARLQRPSGTARQA